MTVKAKRFRIGVEGATTDGREIQREWLEQMAASYNPAVYTALINLEHIKSYLPDSTFTGRAALHSGAYLMKVRAHQYDTVDALCWRHYGRTQGVTEQVLKANPGLAEYGPFLPHGLQVELPDIPTTTTVQTVQLWD